MANSRKQKIARAAEVEALIKRLLNLLLAYHAFDDYWTRPASQSEFKAEDLLRNGQVHGGVVCDFEAILTALGVKF